MKKMETRIGPQQQHHANRSHGTKINNNKKWGTDFTGFPCFFCIIMQSRTKNLYYLKPAHKIKSLNFQEPSSLFLFILFQKELLINSSIQGLEEREKKYTQERKKRRRTAERKEKMSESEFPVIQKSLPGINYIVFFSFGALLTSISTACYKQWKRAKKNTQLLKQTCQDPQTNVVFGRLNTNILAFLLVQKKKNRRKKRKGKIPPTPFIDQFLKAL